MRICREFDNQCNLRALSGKFLRQKSCYPESFCFLWLCIGEMPHIVIIIIDHAELVEGVVVIILGVYLLNYVWYFPNSKWRERCQQKKDGWVPVRGNQQILYICLFLGWLCSGCLNLWEQVKCPFTSLIAPHCHHHHQQQPPLTETLHKTYKYSTKMSTKQHTLSSWCIICMN